MTWLVTGAGGMLGRELAASLAASGRAGMPVIALDRTALDITEPGAVHAAVAGYRPQVVVNCAAFTDVDGAETRAADAWLVNAQGPASLAAACADHGARLIHISTDYVFHGVSHSRLHSPYFEDHLPCPGTAYGRSKLAGERAVLGRLPSAVIVRTAWLYGAHGHNFVTTMAGRARQGGTADVVSDQVGSPTWAADVAGRIVALGQRPEAAGIFHAVNAGEATWCELAREVFRLTGADPGRVRAVSTRARAGQAPRPAYTALGQRRWAAFGLRPLRDWRTALQEAFPHLSRPAAREVR